MADFICTRRVRKDGKVHDAGDVIEIDERQAKPLLAIGAVATSESFEMRARTVLAAAGIVEPAAAEATVPVEATAPEGESPIDRAIRSLKPEDYTATGVPETKAIETALGDGTKVSAAQRDASWARLTATGFKAPTGDET